MSCEWSFNGIIYGNISQLGVFSVFVYAQLCVHTLCSLNEMRDFIDVIYLSTQLRWHCGAAFKISFGRFMATPRQERGWRKSTALWAGGFLRHGNKLKCLREAPAFRWQWLIRYSINSRPFSRTLNLPRINRNSVRINKVWYHLSNWLTAAYTNEHSITHCKTQRESYFNIWAR